MKPTNKQTISSSDSKTGLQIDSFWDGFQSEISWRMLYLMMGTLTHMGSWCSSTMFFLWMVGCVCVMGSLSWTMDENNLQGNHGSPDSCRYAAYCWNSDCKMAKHNKRKKTHHLHSPDLSQQQVYMQPAVLKKVFSVGMVGKKHNII